MSAWELSPYIFACPMCGVTIFAPVEATTSGPLHIDAEEIRTHVTEHLAMISKLLDIAQAAYRATQPEPEPEPAPEAQPLWEKCEVHANCVKHNKHRTSVDGKAYMAGGAYVMTREGAVEPV